MSREHFGLLQGTVDVLILRTLAWTSEYLQKWYGAPPAALTGDQQRVAASLLWLIQGDAGQRALAAWSMGWRPAQAVSGTGWMAAPLATLLNDPYDAVRQVAYRSLRAVPGFETFQYDFLAPPSERTAATLRALALAQRVSVSGRTDSALLLTPAGTPQLDAIVRLGLQRDDRPVILRE